MYLSNSILQRHIHDNISTLQQFAALHLLSGEYITYFEKDRKKERAYKDNTNFKFYVFYSLSKTVCHF